MVVPKTFAQGMRDSGGDAGMGGGYQEQHNYNGGISINAFDSKSVAQMLSSVGGRSALAAGAARYVRRGGKWK